MGRKIPESQPIRIAFLGAGTVGSSALKLYHEQKDRLESSFGPFEISHVVVRNPQKERPNYVPASVLSQDISGVTRDKQTHIVVSLLGNEEAEHEAISKALKTGKYVVTANKVVLARSGQELFKLAGENETGLFIEASIGGGINFVDNLNERFFPTNSFSSVKGIINGTTNFMVTEMARKKVSYASALKKAQALGYAEPNPAADVEGFDAAYKLALMASLSFRKGWLDYASIYREGISKLSPKDFEYAKKLNYAIKLIASAKDTEQGIEAWVAPTLVPLSHPLSRIEGPSNAITLEGYPIGQTTLEGLGAGGLPTAASVWSDIQKAARYLRQGITPLALNFSDEIKALSVENSLIANYIRLTVLDEAGVIGKIGTILGNEGVSINQILQLCPEDRWTRRGKKYAQIVIDLNPSHEGKVSLALKKVAYSPVCQSINSRLRILE